MKPLVIKDFKIPTPQELLSLADFHMVVSGLRAYHKFCEAVSNNWNYVLQYLYFAQGDHRPASIQDFSFALGMKTCFFNPFAAMSVDIRCSKSIFMCYFRIFTFFGIPVYVRTNTCDTI